MRRLALVLLFLAPAAVAAKEEGRTDCGLYAVLRGEDKGDTAIYDGVRKGLELAHLPRVCREEIAPWPGGLRAFVDKLALSDETGRKAAPLFAIGDEACEALAAVPTDLPRVFVVQRYSIARKPILKLPSAPGSAVVYADIGAERLGRVLHDLFGRKGVRAGFSWGRIDAPDQTEILDRFRLAAGLSKRIEEPARHPDVMLHLRLGIPYPLLSIEQAVVQAKQLGVPLVSDDRASFGQGAVVTLVARHGLAGRAAADAGRRLRADPKAKLPPHPITGVRVWVDLKAADEQGIKLPLAFLARADRLKRGKAKR